MKYFEVTEPYYSLIKAEDKAKAVGIYIEMVCDLEDDEDFEIKEISKEDAWDKFKDIDTFNDEKVTDIEIELEFNKEEDSLLMIDISMI